MDIFIEQLVKKKSGPRDYLFFTGIVLIGALVVFLSILFLPSLAIFVLAAVCCGAYLLITSRNLEFEYSVTNGDLTIDRIIAKRKRRRMISVDARTVEKMGKYDPQKLRSKNFDARIFSSETEKGTDAWYLCAHHFERGNVLIVFSPNEKILNSIRPFLQRQVAKDAFGRY
ncbi:hypothetical protein EQM14_09620 [Caproiciproducens sp. NJN-50]|uniref:hypothetical protein n=1 Tax=Acutalibacteraceae TaxID=3082771 RepID=UPI000FFE3211|nr:MULTISPECIES: hypothetical protein [Acutalibacteraceae]QAT50009.1 hypothetical protein EQM14_09620 [Caproiciproducens sp. NJN-50]